MTPCYCHLKGGLGNQLFQIAAAWAHCKRNNYELRLQQNIGGRESYWHSFLHMFAKNVGEPTDGPQWAEPRFSYTPIPPSAQKLHGYYQSSRYFAEYADEFRQLFKSGPPLSSNVCVIHIRLGDYFRGTNKTLHGILTPSYYERAMAAMGDKEFLIYSDDIIMCREMPFLQGKNITFVDEPDDSAALHQMSQAPNIIMSNSTFSWWAVFLGVPKRVIAPDRWFGLRGPQDTQDIYEPSWEKIAV